MDAKQIKKYTAEEFFAATANDDGRYELHNGEIVAQAAPSIKHHIITKRISFHIDKYIESKKGECQVFFAPVDVKLDELNTVQPDIFVVCDPDKIDDKRCNGAPDFVVEITSGNSYNDYVRKLNLYESSGVREYWIVDPDRKSIHVYCFEQELNEIYTFEDSVPVGIYNGELTVNLRELLG